MTDPDLASWITNSIGFEFTLWTADNAGGFRLLADSEMTECVRRAIAAAPSARAALCRECSDRAGEHWRRWAEKQLGDTPAVRAATDQDLRRLLTERLRAPAGHAERIANLEHTIRVMAEATHEGDPASVRMHAEHALGPAPDLFALLQEPVRA